MSPFNDPMHIEIRGTLRRAPPPAEREEEERLTPFGTGDVPQAMPDWSAVYWPAIQRSPFYFRGQRQRDIIRELWQARERGRPYVHQSALLRAVGSNGTRLVELFRQGAGYHPAWGKLIVQGPVPGSYGFAP